MHTLCMATIKAAERAGRSLGIPPATVARWDKEKKIKVRAIRYGWRMEIMDSASGAAARITAAVEAQRNGHRH